MSNNPNFAPEIRARVLPFAVFVIFTGCQDYFGHDARYWLYLVKTLVGLACLLALKAQIPELREVHSDAKKTVRISSLALVAGVFVFVIWVGLNNYHRESAKMGTSWNPLAAFRPPLAWFFVGVRIAGSSLVVPPIEEIFYRSFLYRYIIKPDFAAVPLNRFDPRAFVIIALLFGFAHYPQWLAGILCALIYQGLVVRHGRLREAIVAHATTNFLLGLWVVWKGAWEFW